MSGNCELSRVTSVTPGSSAGDLTTGYVKLTHPATTKAYKTSGTTDGPNVFNMGQPGEANRMLFDVVNGSAPHHRRFVHGGRDGQSHFAKRRAVKAQYGVDCGVPPLPPFVPSGVIVWTSANGNACGRNRTPDDLANPATFTAARLAMIRAVRIAIVVRSDEPDLKDPGLVGQTATLFRNCSTGACAGSINLTNAILADNYRYRIYETVVPMRNAIFNDGT